MCGVDAVGFDTPVDADAMPDAGIGHEPRELTLAAPDLEYALAGEVVSLDPASCELGRKLQESCGEPLGLLVTLAVLGETVVEVDVGDEAAPRAVAKGDGPGREAPCGRHVLEQHVAVRRNGRFRVESLHPVVAACGAPHGERRAVRRR